MAKSIPSNATPTMLKWARTKTGLSVEDVANVEKITIERVNNWENGSETPTLARLRRLAKRYKRPTMVFYLPKPPKDFTVETSLATEAYLRSKWRSLQSAPKEKASGSGGPSQHELALRRTGENFVKLAVSAYYSGELHGGQLSSLLAMKLDHLSKLESVVSPGRVHPLAIA